MGSLPLVTIVTPSLNQGRFLRRTIDSVLGQDYPHIEYLVMDGGSRDNSVEILKSYGSRLKWISGPDGGQTEAINSGFARSRGELRGYLNADDVLLPGAVSRVVEHFQRHPDWDLIYGRAFWVDEKDRILGRYPTEEYSFARLVETCFICQPAAFWRTRLAQRVGPLDADLHFAMDYEYWLRMDRAGGKIVHVPEDLAWSRWHGGSKTLTKRREVYGEIFRVCLRHAGRAGLGHYAAYWHHLCNERRQGWARQLRHWPGLPDRLARLHYHWHQSGERYWPFFKKLCKNLSSSVFKKF